MNIKLISALSTEHQKKIAGKLVFSLDGEELSYNQLVTRIANNPLIIMALAVTSPELGIQVPLGFVKLGPDGRKIVEYFKQTEEGDADGNPTYLPVLSEKSNFYPLLDMLASDDLQMVFNPSTHEALVHSLDQVRFVNNLMKAMREEELLNPSQGEGNEAIAVDKKTGDFTFNQDQYFTEPFGGKGMIKAGTRLPYGLVEDMIFFDSLAEREGQEGRDQTDEDLDPIPDFSYFEQELAKALQPFAKKPIFNNNKHS